MTRAAYRYKQTTGRRRLLTLVASGLVLCLALTAGAQGISSARIVAMGSGGISLAKGVDASRLNPANLGFSSYQLRGVELIGFGANITNNSFTLADYNNYTGAILTDDDKEDILEKVADEGLQLNIDAEAAALSVSIGSVVFGVGGTGIADVNLNKDILELLLNGNTFGDTIEITGSYSEAVAYGSAYISFGRPIYKSAAREVALGATVRYLYGIGVERIVKLEGLAATFATGFEGEGELVMQTSTGGWGYAVDLGAALKLNENYTVGLQLRNFLSSLKWSENCEEHGYTFSFDTMTVDNMEEDYVVSDDYTIDIDDFSTDLPSVMNLGVANTSGKLLWSLDWEQGFRRATGVSTKPRLSAGIELSPIQTLPLRIGYSIGGGRNVSFSFGSGFHLPGFYLDYAMVTGSSFSGYSSKGLNLAITTGVHF